MDFTAGAGLSRLSARRAAARAGAPRAADTGPSELDFIKGEPAFPPALRARDKFKALLRGES